MAEVIYLLWSISSVLLIILVILVIEILKSRKHDIDDELKFYDKDDDVDDES